MSTSTFSFSMLISNALERMKQVLFRPFQFCKWLILGLCAWLAGLLEGGGGGVGQSSGNVSEGGARLALEHHLNWEKLDYILNGSDSWVGGRLIETLGWQSETVQLWGTIIGVGVVLIILLSLVLGWIGSRFQFILLLNLLRNKAEIRSPWREMKRLGNSYFLGMLGIGIVLLLCFGAIIAGAMSVGYEYLQDSAAVHQLIPFGAERIQPLVTLGILGFLCWIVAMYYWCYLQNVVQVLMLLEERPFWSAFCRMHTLFALCPGRFILFPLLYMVLGIASGILVMLLGVLTCCVGFILLSIPVIGAALLLPITVFFRFFAVEFTTNVLQLEQRLSLARDSSAATGEIEA